MSTATFTPPSIATPADRRVAARRQPAMGTVCAITHPDHDDATTGLVWNISATGISMLVAEPWEAGTPLRGELTTIHGRHPLAVGMRVVHVKLLETGDYILGAHFDRALAADEIKPFVA